MKPTYTLRCAFILLLMSSCINSFSQFTTFERTFGGAQPDYGHAIASTADGGLIITGLTLSFGDTLGDTYLIKTDTDGNQQWVQIISGPALEGGNSVIQTTDGGYFIVCHTESYGAGDCDSWALKTDNLGNIQWSQTHGCPDDDVGYDGIQTSDGSYIVTGIYRGTDWRGNAFAVKYASDGTEMWVKEYGDTASTENGARIIQCTDGGFVLAGGINPGTGQSDILVMKIDANGNLLWSENIGGPSDEVSYGLCTASDGGYIVCGYTKSLGTGDADVYIVKLNDSGTQLWSRNYGGINDDVATHVIAAQDGGYVLSGITKSFGDSVAALIIKTDAYGNMSWMRTFGESNFLTEGNRITACSDGGFAMTGSRELTGSGNPDLYLVKTDNDGILNGIDALESVQKGFVIYPNPARDFISLTFAGMLLNPDIRIYNETGSLIIETGNQRGIDVSSLSHGMYCITARDGNKLYYQKFIRD